MRVTSPGAERMTRAALRCSAALAASCCAAGASAQEAPEAATQDDRASEIVVTGQRGSAVTDLEPLATFDERAVAATGATSMPELLRAIQAVTKSADGGEPIFLLNAQRVSGYPEIGALPPEAIEKVEVLPEAAALKFGYPPTRRVVNFITKARFRQVALRGTAGVSTRGGAEKGLANLGLTRLRDGGRLTLGLEYRHTEPVLLAQRDIALDPNIPYDPLGNITGVGGGEIDPALSAAAGQVVTVAPVPEAAADRTSLAGYAAGANQPRLYADPHRTLAPRNDAVKAEAVIAKRIGKTLAGSLSLSLERSRDRERSGPALAALAVPASNAFSPFSRNVLLDRYLVEADPLRASTTTTTLHAGAVLRGAISGWRWDFTAALDQKQIDGTVDTGIDTTAANAAIAAGANPFAPLDPALLADRLTNRTRQRTRTANARLVVTNTPVRVPAGEVSVIATAETEQASASSETRGPSPYDLSLARLRTEGSIAVSIPLTSRSADVLGWAGDLSINASAYARQIGGFGRLSDTIFGASWAPFKGIQLVATIKNMASAPGIEQLSIPETRIDNVPVFDFGNGRTELVTMIRGGNPDLAAERRHVTSLALNIKPFAKKEIRFSATYEATSIRNQTGTIYANTPDIEAILPELVERDASGRLVSAIFRPLNLYREEQRTLNFTISANGRIGKPPPRPKPGEKPAQPRPAFYYGGIGPSVKLSDRLQLRPGAPVFDVLGGDTITGSGTPRVFGYAYGGFNIWGNGLQFDGWYGGGSRVRSPNPATDLRFSPMLRLNIGATISVHHFLRDQDWTKKLQLKLDVSNITDSRYRVRDGNGRVPFRYQSDLLDATGRTVSLTLRKLF